MMLLGHSAIGQMAMPLLPIQIAIAVWLIVKGFSTKNQRLASVLKNSLDNAFYLQKKCNLFSELPGKIKKPLRYTETVLVT